MKNTNEFFLRVSASVFFTIGATMMLFSNTFLSGGILLVIGFLTALPCLSKRKYFFEDAFLFVSAFLGLILLIYLFFVSYSKNVVTISSSFYALNFLIQVARHRRVKVVKKIKNRKSENIRVAIKELKKEIKPKKTYFFTETGKSFHLAGCISLSRTKRENLKKETSRKKLIEKGYKTCKSCNS